MGMVKVVFSMILLGSFINLGCDGAGAEMVAVVVGLALGVILFNE